MLQLRCPPAQRKGTGRSLCTCQGRWRRPRPAHARPPPEGWDAEGRAPLPARARSLARPPVRSRRPAGGFPACAPGRSHSGACARGLGPTRVAGFPRLPAPAAPSRLPANPFLPFLTEWGRRCSGSRALDPARARSRAVSRCLARAALRFPSVSGAEGSVKRRPRPRFLFPFLPLPSVGSSILHPATPPTLPARPAAAEGSGGGDGGRRRPPRSRLGSLKHFV
ncbi:skin secretory protein xP2-like isoform X2 [Alexandromys fortis]|uniref:skin secretory protein xP2-like isoform X2 n=1 Tax=Alexandromys fortis TaxID=100897 RepID=UPI002152DFCD|nr:skin secretory protein xP2-like isoform X2 [Microtus fortis]